MSNLRFLFRNLADAATMTADPAVETTLPVTNLQRQTERARTMRTTGLASQDVKLTWAAVQAINMAALTRHNLTTAATWRNLGYSGAAWTGAEYDSTALTAFSTSGLDTALDIYTEADFAHLRASALYFATESNIHSWITRLADAANPDGFMEATRLFLGKYVEVTYNPPEGGVELTTMDGSVSARVDDGTHIVDKRWKARRLVLDLQFIPDEAELNSLLAGLRYVGIDRELFVSLYPGVGGVKEIYNQMACRVVESPVFRQNVYGHHSTRVVLEET